MSESIIQYYLRNEKSILDLTNKTTRKLILSKTFSHIFSYFLVINASLNLLTRYDLTYFIPMKRLIIWFNLEE